jgi:hypothetical protein
MPDSRGVVRGVSHTGKDWPSATPAARRTFEEEEDALNPRLAGTLAPPFLTNVVNGERQSCEVVSD